MDNKNVGLVKYSVVKNMTPEERIEGLMQCLGFTAVNLANAAIFLRSLDEDRIDVSGKCTPDILENLRRIYSNQLLPDVMVKFGNGLRKRVAALPLSEQQKLCVDDSIEVWVDDGGKLDKVKLRASGLDKFQCDQVFDRTHIRDEKEQIAYLRSPLRKEENKIRRTKTISRFASLKPIEGRKDIFIFVGDDGTEMEVPQSLLKSLLKTK